MVFDVEVMELEGGATIHTYSLCNVLAEKMRSLLQQPIRKRNRRQDVYDIRLSLETMPKLSIEDLSKIHQILVASCQSKGIEPHMTSMELDEVFSMARSGYQDLAADVDGVLPSFDDTMARVTALYRALPW